MTAVGEVREPQGGRRAQHRGLCRAVRRTANCWMPGTGIALVAPGIARDAVAAAQLWPRVESAIHKALQGLVYPALDRHG